MFIEKIYLKNFGNVKEQSLEFTSGINLFSGNNGEGKSTVLKAISLFLFNSYEGNLEDYVQWGEDSFIIHISFFHLGKNYKGTMEFSKKGGTKKEVKNLETHESYNNSGANEFLNSLLDIKRALASTTSFEGKVDLITTPPSARREYLKGIYDLSFKKELETIEEDIKNTEGEKNKLLGIQLSLKAQTFEKQVLERPPFSYERYQEYIQLKDSSQEKITLLMKEKDSIISTKKLIIEKGKKLKSLQDLIMSLKRDQKNLEEALNEIDKQVGTIDIPSSLDFIDQQYQKLESDLIIERDTKKDLIHSLEKEKTDLEKEKELLEGKKSELEKEKALLDSKIDVVWYSFNQLEKQIEILKKGQCPTCGQEIDSTLLEEALKEQGSKKKEKEGLLDKKSSIVKELNSLDLEGVIDKLYKVDKEIRKESLNYLSQIENQLNTIKERLANDKKQKEKELIQRIELLEEKKKSSFLQNESLEKEIDRSYTYIEEIEKEIEDLESNLASHDSIDEKIEKEKGNLYQYTNLIKKYDFVDSSNKEKKRLNEEISKKELENTKEIERVTSELHEVMEDLEIYTLSKKIISRELPSFILTRIITSLKLYLNEFLVKVYPFYELHIEESKNALKILYGKEKSDVKLASGFEKQIFSFAYKYALGRLQNYEILFLDEVDSAASESNSKQLYETLGKMDSCFKQIFIISHKEEIKDLLRYDYNARVFETHKGEYRLV
jgi:DNA repair exonuclease SbcCD ATPase subunit